MNTKIANLIVLELGILIAILAWLAFSNRSSVKPHPVAEEQERTAGSFATLTPELKARNQRLYAADNRAEREAGQQGEEQAQTVREYDQEIATSPYASSDLYDDVTTGSSPYYAGVAQGPVVYPPDYFVSPLDQIVACPQPTEIIVFSNARSFGRRHLSTARFGGARMMAVHRPPGGAEFRAPGRGLVSRRTSNPRSFRPSRGFGPR